MDGGATVGYCAIGSCLMATPPTTMMNSAITQAKIGRSIKKRAIADKSFYWRVLPGPAAAPAAGEPAIGVFDDERTVLALAPATLGAAPGWPAVAGAGLSVCGVQATGCTGVPG